MASENFARYPAACCGELHYEYRRCRPTRRVEALSGLPILGRRGFSRSTTNTCAGLTCEKPHQGCDMYPETTPNSVINSAVQLIPQEQELRECSPRAHTPATASRVTGKTFTREVAVKGLSCLLILAALVACTGKSGDSSTTPPALAFTADCQGKTSNPFTQPPVVVPSSFLPDDGSIQVPPTAGPLGYNTFIPGSAGFPAVGGTYTDPIFGGTVRRLTDTVGQPNQEDIYAHHWANANGSLAFSRQLDLAGLSFKIINTTTGAEVYTNQPLGSSQFDIAWDAIDPNRYYYYEGTNLTCRNLAEQRNVVKTFPSPLERNGGSLNTQDRSGRYFTVRYGGSNKVWDSQTDTIYSGSVTPLNPGGGWVAITPDGNYLVTAAGPLGEHHSYAIDHVKHSISLNPVNFWTACQTDHGALVSATDGNSYFITFDCNNSAGIYRVDITLDQTGKTEPEQIVANQLLLPTVSSPVNTNQGHLSAVSKGPNQDWVFFDSETLGGDPFALATTSFVPFLPWQPYEQEIVAMNVTTLEVRRYAHHRSRGIDSDYHAQPRISCSWDGSIILWTSNYNTSSPTGYADMYGMAFSGN